MRRAVGEGPQVHARAERPVAGAREHDGPDVGIGLGVDDARRRARRSDAASSALRASGRFRRSDQDAPRRSRTSSGSPPLIDR